MILEFNSQICTNKEQSERLLALGLKKETADGQYAALVRDWKGNLIADPKWRFYDHNECFIVQNFEQMECYPTWSLHRLIEMLNYQVRYNGKTYEPVIAIDGMAYCDICADDPIVGWSKDLYTDAIDCIEWLIGIEQFNKRYLVE